MHALTRQLIYFNSEHCFSSEGNFDPQGHLAVSEDNLVVIIEGEEVLLALEGDRSARLLHKLQHRTEGNLPLLIRNLHGI